LSRHADRADSVIGWRLDAGERAALLARVPPHYANVVADRVTLRGHQPPDAALPDAKRGEIVGHADDGVGVEALVVAIDGSTDRPDGSIGHVTWSLAPGREARESNDIIAARGWAPVSPPIPLALRPARFP
jgi:hypothetical protein